MSESAEKVYLSFHKSFVKENIPYIDRSTGEDRTFNSVTLPFDTVIDGRNVGGFQFSPLYIDPSKYDENQRVVPLLANREVWLTKTARDADGNVLLDQDGNPEKETLKVMPAAIKEALAQARRAWSQQRSQERSLQERAGTARSGAGTMRREGDRLSDRDIPF
ncbi:DNA gyrase [Eggerthella lenta]|uniref:DNA gyrase n=1 Tax=Eggerthella lenta TaxID=84112 RepID=UPI0018AB5DDD|nr:DNA gyrase [Eggerthella lenta]MDB1756721.1 DNA gyrase [Eggerthella lenta]MDB1763311.1 DNA gyrase [Eggerthella lenta]